MGTGAAQYAAELLGEDRQAPRGHAFSATNLVNRRRPASLVTVIGIQLFGTTST